MNALRALATGGRSFAALRACSGPLLGELRQQGLAMPQPVERVRQRRVAAMQQRASVSSRFVVPGWPVTKTSRLRRARLAPLKVVRRLDGLAVLVDAEEADVEVEARELEVVDVAAEEGDACSGANTRRTSVYFL